MILASFGLRDQNHQYSWVYQDWFMVCAQWRWQGEKKINVVSVLDDVKRFINDHSDDYHVVKTLRDLISSADIVVAHNGDGFDMKKLKAKIVQHRIEPIRIPQSIDTLKWARKFGFTSKKLGDLCKRLELKSKLGNDSEIWPKSAQGDVASIRKMIKYGKGDIPTLEELYNVLLPYADSHPNMNLYNDTEGCTKCGSQDYQQRGYIIKKTGKVKRFQCKGCGSWFQGGKTVKRVDLR